MTKRKETLARAQALMHESMFGLTRIGYDLINILVWTGGNHNVEVSDHTLHQLRVQARRALKGIDQTIDLLRPYAKKRLADPDGAFASLEKDPR